MVLVLLVLKYGPLQSPASRWSQQKKQGLKTSISFLALTWGLQNSEYAAPLKRSAELLPVLGLKPFWEWRAVVSVSASVTPPVNASLKKIRAINRERKEASNGMAAAWHETNCGWPQWRQPAFSATDAAISVCSEPHLTLDSQGQRLSLAAADTHCHGWKRLGPGQSRVTWAQTIDSFLRFDLPNNRGSWIAWLEQQLDQPQELKLSGLVEGQINLPQAKERTRSNRFILLLFPQGKS